MCFFSHSYVNWFINQNGKYLLRWIATSMQSMLFNRRHYLHILWIKPIELCCTNQMSNALLLFIMLADKMWWAIVIEMPFTYACVPNTHQIVVLQVFLKPNWWSLFYKVSVIIFARKHRYRATKLMYTPETYLNSDYISRTWSIFVALVLTRYTLYWYSGHRV